MKDQLLQVLLQAMGNRVSDFYQIQDIRSMHQRDFLPILYVWIDYNIKNSENCTHSSSFKEFLTLIEVDTIEKMVREIEKWSNAQHRVRVISAASFPENMYQRMQDNAKIDRIVLFCRTNARSYSLLRHYSKIKQTCNSPADVVKAFLSWERLQQRRLIVFEQESVRYINQYHANILSLCDKKQILPSEARKCFEEYCLKFVVGDRSQMVADLAEYEAVRNKEEELWRFMERKLATDSPILPVVNSLLISTLNPKKLAYIRYFISDIYHLIINRYSDYSQQSKEYYSVMPVNEVQLLKIRSMRGRYLSFTYFLQANSQDHYQIQMSNDVRLTIRIPETTKKQHCNGYVINQNSIFFNIGNYFKIEDYNQDFQRLVLSLLHLEESSELDLTSQPHCIYLNQINLINQHAKYQGQWHAILLNQPQAVSNEYINMKINALLAEGGHEDIIFRYRLNNYRHKFSKGIHPQDFQSFLLEKQAQQIRREEQLVECLCLLCEFYWSNRNTQKVEECIKKLYRYQVFIKSEQLQLRYNLLRYGYNTHCSHNHRDLARIQADLNKIEADLMKLCFYFVSQNYHLLLKVRIRCHQQAGQLDEALAALNKLMRIYNMCKGRSSEESMQLHRLKADIIERRDVQAILMQKSMKERLFTSGVSFTDLRKKNIPQKCPINLAGIDLHFYN